jgi:septum formation inhibitor-activating ATPase MinD
MKNNPDIPATDTTEIKQLINRLKQGELDQGDAQLIEKLLNILLTIVSPSEKTHINSANKRSPVWNQGEKAGQGRS